jgi:hypothetical protein
MPLSLESLSDDAKIALLVRIAHTLTICARDTYEVGTEEVLNPQILRAGFKTELMPSLSLNIGGYLMEIQAVCPGILRCT